MVDYSDAPAGSVSSPERPPDGLQEFRVAPLVSSQLQKDANVQVEKAGFVPTVKLVGVVTRFDQAALPGEARPPEQRGGDKFATYESLDAARVEHTRDGATIYFDANNRVSGVHYANGDLRSFTYDGSGQLAAIAFNGYSHFVENGKMITASGIPMEIHSPTISADGTYSFTTADGRTVSTHTDRSRTITRADGSAVAQDPSYFVTGVKYPDGRTRSFTYGDSSRLITSFTDVDGKRYDYDPSAKSPGRTFRAADGSTVTNLEVEQDGTVQYQNKDTTTSVFYTSGDESRTSRTAFDFIYAAFVLRPDNRANLDDSNVKYLLEKMTPADRLALDIEYARQHRTRLSRQLETDAENPLKRANAQAALRMIKDAWLIEAGKKQ